MVYIFLAEGYEELEAVAPIDVMRRAGIPVKIVGMSLQPSGRNNIRIVPDMTIDEFDPKSDDMTMIMLPGGMLAVKSLEVSKKVQAVIDIAMASNKYIAAICAAPIILGRKGLLQGKRATSYPGLENELTGHIPSDEPVVVDGNIITSIGAGTATRFGLKLVEILCGKAKADKIKDDICLKI